MGRDPSLTGRTEIWKEVLALNTNPILGTGFESFWLGDRLEKIWANYWWHPNEAHNGYLEVYLNLGLVGVVLLAGVIVTGYRNVIRLLRWDAETGRIILAFFVVGIVYSFTEAGFRVLGAVWIFFLLATMAAPRRPVHRTRGARQSLAQTVISESHAEADMVFLPGRAAGPKVLSPFHSVKS
jgi:O-antigen ligase